MKTSNTKRALAFWLAVAMLAGSAPAALAAEFGAPAQVQTNDASAAGTETQPGDGQTPEGGETPAAPVDISNATVELAESTFTYTGEAQTPAVKSVVVSDTTLAADDYTVSYADNTNVGTAKVTIQPKDTSKYTGKATKEFTIGQADVEVSAPKSVSFPYSADKSDMDYKTAIAEAVQKSATVTGVNGETISGSFAVTNVGAKEEFPKAVNTANSQFTGAGVYNITLNFTHENTNYKTPSTVTVTCDLTGTTEQEIAFTKAQETKIFGDEDFTNALTTKPTNAVTYASSKPEVATVGTDGKVTIKGAGTTTITAEVRGDGTNASGKASYTLTVNPKNVSSATIAQVAEQTYTGSAIKPELTVKDGATALTKGTDYDVTYTDNIFPGTAHATVTFKGNYTGTAKTDFTIKAASYTNTTINQAVIAGEDAVLNIPTDLAKAEITHYGDVAVEADSNEIVKGTPTRDENTITAKIKKAAVNGQTADVKIALKTKGYGEITLTYHLTVSDSKQQLTSSQIRFADKTVTANGNYFKLDNASLIDVTDTNGKWTYALKEIHTLNNTQGEMPSFKEPGKYTIVASYQGDKYVGSKEATLTIKSEDHLAFSVSNIGGNRNENHNEYDWDTTSKSGSFRIDVEGDDDLTSFRPHSDMSKEYWIGFDLTAKADGTTYKPSELYYRMSDSGSWKALEDDKDYGYFHIDFDGDDFELWFDTDDDTDTRDSIYLATSSNGANEIELIVDFDSYSGSSSGGGSGSSSSDTSKVDGDYVSVTTIDKTPSVSKDSATVSISSSAMSDALDENKREARREDADKTYIELDVKTSKTVDDTTITVPRSSLDKLADEDTGLILTTNHGTVTFDDRALAEIYDTCDRSDVKFYIEEDDDQYTLLIKDGSDEVIDLGNGEAEITFNYKLKSGESASDVKVYRTGDGDKKFDKAVDMKADYSSSKKKATFTTDVLGTFLVTTDEHETGSGDTDLPSYTNFIDVPASRWSAPYINQLASLGVINGTGGGYFEPTLYVTREEFVKMLAGVAGANVNGYTSSRFPDVPMSRWSAPYIAWAADRGITTGTDGGRFAPTMKITREEMATMIYRYVQSAGETLPQKNAPVIFADADRIDGWAQTPVSVMQQAGIIDGNVTNGRYTFDPMVPATREECAKMLAVLYNLL